MKVLSVTLAWPAGILLSPADSKPLRSCRVMERLSDHRAASPGSFEIKHSTPVPTVWTWQNKSRVYIIAFLFAIKNEVIKCMSLSNQCLQNMKNLLSTHCFKTGCMCLAKKALMCVLWNKLQCKSIKSRQSKRSLYSQSHFFRVKFFGVFFQNNWQFR